MAAARILVAEDHTTVARDIKERLNSLGYSVPAVAHSGETALQQAKELRPDLVLMDIRLQGDVNGIEAAVRLRDLLDIPVVFLAACADDDALQRAKVTWPFGCILKPFAVQELHSTIEMALHKHKIDRRVAESEARYRAVSELTSDFAYSFALKRDGTRALEWVTETFGQVTGYSPEQVFQQGYAGFVHEDDAGVVSKRLETLLAGQPITAEFRVITKEGRIRWLRDYARPERDETADRIVRIIGAAQDISEQALADSETRRRASELDALQNTVLDITASQDLDSLLEIIVERAARLLGSKSGALYLCDPYMRQVRCVVSFGRRGNLTGRVLAYGEGVAGRVAERGEPLIIDHQLMPQSHSDADHALPDLSTVLAVPMTWNDRVMGVIQLIDDASRRVFSNADLVLLKTFANHAAIAVENTRLYEQAHTELTVRLRAEKMLRRRNKELALFNRLAQELTSSLDLRQIAEQLLPAVTGALGVEGASVWLWDEEHEDALICRAIAHGSELSLVYLQLSPDQGVAGWTVRTAQSAIVNDVGADPRFYPGIDELLGFRTRSLLAVPLEARGKVIGVLEAVNKLQGDFDGEDLAMAEMMATSAGIAIDNAHLFEMLQQRNRDLALLNQTGQALGSLLDLDQVLVTILEEVCRMLGVTASSLWLVDTETQELVCHQATGPQRDAVRGWRVPLGEGILGHAARTGKSLIVPDSRSDPRHFPGVDRVTGIEMRSILSVPLQQKGQMIGVLQLVDEEPNRFRPIDQMLLESVAATAAIAVENARLYEQAQQDALAKSMLLHEVNHRVKNNLSAIIGILYVERQHAEIKDQEIYQSIMRDLINRVQGLATVHHLLSSADWTPLRLSDLAARVIHSSLQTLARDKRVLLDVHASPVRVTPDQAHHLGLVINELATNTIKHGLNGTDAGHIEIIVGHEGDEVWCEYRDDGPGYPDSVLSAEERNVGFDLIQTIVNEGLRGELSLYNEGGAVAVIRFKAQVAFAQAGSTSVG